MSDQSRHNASSPYDFIFSGSSNYPLKNIERDLHIKRIFSMDVQIRRNGESSFGNGVINIEGNLINLRYKRFLGKENNINFTYEDIENIEFKNRGISMQFVPQNLPEDQTWLTMDIKLRKNCSYSFYIGQQLDYKDVEKFDELCEVLNRSSKLKGPSISYIYENMKK